MSLPQPQKPNESKAKSKFQSLNINTLYQGAANKATSKNLPQKHGLQSLGKVPTARRAPANLPSVKSEKGGNDPTVVLVPTGGSGWAKDGEKAPGGVEEKRENQTSSAPQDAKKEPAVAAKPSGPKSWSSITGAAQPAAPPGQPRPQQAFLHQKSPLFVQEFPSLRPGEIGAAKAGSPDSQSEAGSGAAPAAAAAAAAARSQLEQPAGKDEQAAGEQRAVPAYGPGPSLRPQTFGNWTQGGLARPGGGAAESSPGDAAPLLLPQPHKPTPPGPPSSLLPSKSPPPRGNPANQYKSIMPPFMDVMELPTAPPDFLGNRRGRERAAPAARREPPRSNGTGRPEFVPPSIIDTEKLRRMDDLADDWTYDDENFDYNKRLQSDDEENDVVVVEAPSSRPDPNWADQVERLPEPVQPPQPYNFYEDMKKSAVGFVLDEEERRRNKKSEEVMKNIERARQRREEEENRYRRPGSEEYYRNEDRPPREPHPGGRRFEESSKENKAPDRREWANEDKSRRPPRNMDERRDGRFDERRDEWGSERYDAGGRRDGYYAPPRFERRDREDKGRREEYRRDEPLFEGDYKSSVGGHHGYQGARPVSRDRGGRGFEERGRAAHWEEEPSFEDAGRVGDRRKPERRWSGKSPTQPRRDSEKSHSGSPEAILESDWMGRGSKPVTDWVEDVEKGDGMEKFDLDGEHKEADRPSRPTSRDSRVSRDSQGSKQSKGSRNSGDKLGRKLNNDYHAAEPKEQRKPENEPSRSAHPLLHEYDMEKKVAPVRKPQAPPAALQQAAAAPTDLRGYFRDAPLEEKKMARTAPGPITREKLEAAEAKEMTGMTQLRKRDAKLEMKPVEPEEVEKLAPLVDSDLLENISEDEDTLLEGVEREDRNQLDGRGGRGRHRGVQQPDQRKQQQQHQHQQQQQQHHQQQQQQLQQQHQQQQQQFMGRAGAPVSGRGDRGAGRGGAVRGGRAGRPASGRWSENDLEGEESEEARKNRKNREEKAAVDPKFSQPPPMGFTLRGQPSRRGRGGESRGRIGGTVRRPGMEGQEAGGEEAGDWGEEDSERKVGLGRGGGAGSGSGKPMPPRMQRKKEDMGGRPRYTGKEGEAAGDGEDWETASENSNEDKRNPDRQRPDNDRSRGGRGGKPWEARGRRGGPGGLGGPPHAGGGQHFGGVGGVSFAEHAREQTPESAEGFKKRAGIENFDLHDYASVVVVDQANENVYAAEQEFEGMEGSGEFMQVVNRKMRLPPQSHPPPPLKEDRRSFERQGPKMGEKVAYNDYKYREYNKEAYDKKINKTSFDRRQSKLPPRLAKQREVSRAQARTGLSPTGMEANGWPEGDKMGVFQVEDLGTTAWEKPPTRRDKDGIEVPMDLRSSPKVGKETSGIQQTMVFENTALKSVKAGDKLGLDKSGGIQLPMGGGGGKPEDAGDLKLDFTFGGDDLAGQGKPPVVMPRVLPHLAASQGLPASPSTDDLSAKLANTKKLWDAPGMPVVQENSVAGGSSWNDAATFNDNFEGFQENQAPEGGAVYDKNENGGGGPVNNVAKVKPQQQHLSMDQDNRPSQMQYNRLTNNGMLGAIPSPPTQMGPMGALQAQPWAFQLERTSPMYNPYGASQLSQSILMPGAHSIGTDLFTGSNGAGGYRLQSGAGHYPGAQQNPTSNVLISQANLISGGVKHSNQIGPIGTKAGTGASTSPYLQSGLGALPNTFIQYEPSNYNYVNPNAAGMQRGNAPPSQTAFYQTLANRQPQLALNALQGTYNHAMSQQQMRAANHVTGLPYMKNDMGGMGQPNKSPLNENFEQGPPKYNNGRSQGGPPSPKTKLKMDQQQQHQQASAAAAKMAAGMSSMNNLNNLNHMAQLRMSTLGYNLGMGYNPSPIARPQITGQGGMPHMGPGKGHDYYAAEGGEDKLEGEGEGERGGGQEGGKEGEAHGNEEQEAPVPAAAAASTAPHM